MGTVDFLDLANPVDSESSIHASRIGLISQFRESWLKHEHISAMKRAYRCAPRVRKEQELFNGQSVYFWKQESDKTPHARQKWRGPAIIVGNWGSRLIIGYHNSLYQIAAENLRATQDTLDILGVTNELQLHTPGGTIPVSEVVDSRFLVFLYRLAWARKSNTPISYKHMMANVPQFLEEMQIPENSQSAKYILGGEENFDKFIEDLKETERRCLGDEVVTHMENLRNHVKKQNEIARKNATTLEYKIAQALKNNTIDKKDGEEIKNDLQENQHFCYETESKLQNLTLSFYCSYKLDNLGS